MAIPQSQALIARERVVVSGLLRYGATYRVSCAAVGDATQESLCRPMCPSDDGSDGLWQWRDAKDVHRLSDLKAWCAQRKLIWSTVDAQCQYFLFEVRRDFPELWKDFEASTKSVATLTANIMEQFERPNPKYAELDNRIDAANYCFAHFKDLIPPSDPDAIPKPPTYGPPEPPPQRIAMGKNWQTTLGGAGSLLGSLGLIFTTISHGQMPDTGQIATLIGLISAGMGLLHAKDKDVTGGTVPQTVEAEVRTGKPL